MSFLTMKNTVAKRCRVANSGWNVEVIGTYLNECQAELARMPIEWKVLEQQDTSTCVVSQPNYAVPSDFVRALSVNLETGSTYLKLLEHSYDSLRGILNLNAGATGQPEVYAYHYQQLWLAPEPSAAYTFRLDYIGIPTDMSADGDTTVFPEKLLMQYAMAYFKKDLGRMNEFDKEYELYLRELQNYIDAQDRGPDRLDGFGSGLSTVSPYYSQSAQSGSGSVIKSVRDL